MDGGMDGGALSAFEWLLKNRDDQIDFQAGVGGGGVVSGAGSLLRPLPSASPVTLG